MIVSRWAAALMIVLLAGLTFSCERKVEEAERLRLKFPAPEPRSRLRSISNGSYNIKKPIKK